ncbi:PREDICTED: ubiquilin-1-like [Calidris pugnax]|uniref:ubiquilin-1-like n=1 Tax=Calidris pugnax TaxID=198806 RepID=UPI00071C6D60|nr:PREDICTED: ubiquilin-1-like [Calidris pugnax]
MSGSKGVKKTSQPVVTMDPSNIIKVTVKTLKQKEQFEVAQSSTIQEFKEEVAKRFKTLPGLLVLIFAGKILKDQDTLSQHGVNSGVSIHVVIRSQKRPQESQADQGNATTLVGPPSHSDSNLFYLGSTPDLRGTYLIHHSLSRLLISSQEIVAETMEDLLLKILTSGLDVNTINNNPFLLGFLLGATGAYLIGLDQKDVTDLMSSIQEEDVNALLSEMIQNTLAQNDLDRVDLVRNLIMSNPQMQQLTEENPEIGRILTNTIREILEAPNNPAVMQEMIRNRDVAISNLESNPGMYSTLEQLYREFEEPILNALQAQLGNNPFESLDSHPPPSGARLPAHTENCRPLPNPWALQSDSISDNADDHDGQLTSSSEDDGFAIPTLDAAADAAVPISGGVQSMVQQITENAELMQNLESALTNPNSPVQRLLSSLHISSDRSSPPQDQWEQPLPPEMEDAEISSLLRNPRALRALLQIQLGLQTLSIEVPDFILSLKSSGVDLESMEDSAQSSECEEEDEVLMSDECEEESQMVTDDEVPQARFEGKMEQLVAMGFQDQGANLQALIDAEGDVSAAAEILAKGPPPKETP